MVIEERQKLILLDIENNKKIDIPNYQSQFN